MDARLSPEQQALQASAAQVVDDLGPHQVADLDDRARADKLDAAVAAAGWRELRAADVGDRPLASAVEAALVAEELGRGLADVAFLGPTLAADLRRRAGAPAAAEHSTEAVALRADLTGLVDLTRPDGALAVDARGADGALGLVPTGDGHALGRVPIEPRDPQLDLTTREARLSTVPADELPDQQRPLDADDLARVIALGLALTSADLVGVMRGAVELARSYAAERRQFDATIGSFQAVQHLLADAHVATEGTRSAARHAAWAVDALPAPDALAAGAAAKAYAARAAREVCETAIQVHGGIGNTWECPAHLYLRRALSVSDLFGGVDANLARVLAHQGLALDPGIPSADAPDTTPSEAGHGLR